MYFFAQFSRLPDVVARFIPGVGRYQVLFTDYKSFSILWSCSSIANIGFTGIHTIQNFELDCGSNFSILANHCYISRSNLVDGQKSERFRIGNEDDNT